MCKEWTEYKRNYRRKNESLLYSLILGNKYPYCSKRYKNVFIGIQEPDLFLTTQNICPFPLHLPPFSPHPYSSIQLTLAFYSCTPIISNCTPIIFKRTILSFVKVISGLPVLEIFENKLSGISKTWFPELDFQNTWNTLWNKLSKQNFQNKLFRTYTIPSKMSFAEWVPKHLKCILEQVFCNRISRTSFLESKWKLTEQAFQNNFSFSPKV